MAAQQKKAYDVLIKLLLIGDSGVGKSCLLLRYVDDYFTTNFIATIGIDFKVKTITLDGKRIKLQIWDTAGQEKFHTITTAYYRGAEGIFLVYDVTDEGSFEGIHRWIRQIEKHAPDNVARVLIGNKSDLVSQRIIETNQGEQLAKEFNIPFFETSAKDNAHVESAFVAISKLVLAQGERKKQNGLELNADDGKTSSCNC